MVAGACAALQANNKVTNFGAVLTPFQVREILRASGSPQVAGIHPVTENIGPRPDLRNALQYVSVSNNRWVDFGWAGTEAGTYLQPFNTLPEGVNAVPAGGGVIFKSGTTLWTGTFPLNKAMTLRTFGGPVTIGQ